MSLGEIGGDNSVIIGVFAIPHLIAGFSGTLKQIVLVTGEHCTKISLSKVMGNCSCWT